MPSARARDVPSARRVLIAPDSFKGSLGARAVAEAIAAGWRAAAPADRIRVLPLADGGEGTIEAIAAAVPGARLRDAGEVTGPDGRPVRAHWLALPDGTAVVELAVSSGLPLMAAPDPLRASTRGLGEIVRRAAEAGAASVVIGLGGSASTDGGAGALAALGMRLLDERGAPLGDGGGELVRLTRVDGAGLVPLPPVTLLVDVDAPLLGPRGAAAVFAPQKGAGPAEVERLERGLARFAAVLGGDPGLPGSGAAGGSGYGLRVALAAEVVSGADRVAAIAGLDAALAEADVVVTGEGRFDAQSLGGKAVGRLLARAGDVPVALVAGRLDRAAVPRTVGTTGAAVRAISLAELAGSAEAALRDPEPWLHRAGELLAGA